MARYSDPRLAAHAEGLEQRIIELGHRVEVAQAEDVTGFRLARLKARRRRLLDELSVTADAMTRRLRRSSVLIRARRVKPGPRP